MYNNIPNQSRPVHKFMAFLFALPLAAMIFFVIYSLEAIVFKLIWNWVVVDVFKLRPVTFLEAFGLVIISLIIFGGLNKNKS